MVNKNIALKIAGSCCNGIPNTMKSGKVNQ